MQICTYSLTHVHTHTLHTPLCAHHTCTPCTHHSVHTTHAHPAHTTLCTPHTHTLHTPLCAHHTHTLHTTHTPCTHHSVHTTHAHPAHTTLCTQHMHTLHTHRFAYSNTKNQLPQWLRPNVRTYDKFGLVQRDLIQFFKNAQTEVHALYMFYTVPYYTHTLW